MYGVFKWNEVNLLEIQLSGTRGKGRTYFHSRVDKEFEWVNHIDIREDGQNCLLWNQQLTNP